MLLALPSDVISQLGFDAMTDITFAVNMAMDAAEAYLSAQLNTDFSQGTFVDTFFVEQRPRVEIEFRLNRGLLSSVTSVLLSPDPTQFATPANCVNVTANVVPDLDRGVIKDFTTGRSTNIGPNTWGSFQQGYARNFVQITYQAGFATDPSIEGPPGSYLISSVPDWLQQACKIKTLLGLVDSPVLSEAQIKLDQNLLGQQLVYLLSRKLRYAPSSILPL